MRRTIVLALVAGLAGACATARAPVEPEVAARIRTATGAVARLEGAPATDLPPAIEAADGLTSDEAVAIALWRNAAFQVAVSQLGFARAELVDAGLLTNPVLALLLPVGPKQLEATLRLPAEVLWERPRRRAAAGLALDVAASQLVQAGLELALAVRLAHADLALAGARQELAAETAAALTRIDALTQARLRTGDISEIEARIAAVDAARARQDAERVVHDVRLARERLRLLLGLAADDGTVDRVQGATSPASCGGGAKLVADALAARPDVRAAELAVEAAGARLGWERRRIGSFVALLDANGEGRRGFEAGPGAEVPLPIFNWNQGGRLRAEAELQRASTAYLALQQQVGLDVREATTLLDQARQSLAQWRATLLAPLEGNRADAETAYRAGDSSMLVVLEATRRLIEARVRERELVADEARAIARLERATGARCEPGSGGTR